MMSTTAGRSNSRYLFTPSQWQELEHQALIYKYMASGSPIPPDLIHPIRRSFLLDSTLATSPSLAFSPQPSSLGWGCFQVGFGRKAEDPEPGRCRRTDGKKWRCSKEAYADSKYCEKHMHRGKNRSRKPVEMSLAAPNSSSTTTTSSSTTTAQSSTTTNTSTTTRSPYMTQDASPYYHHLYPYATSARQPPAAPAFHTQMNPFHLNLDNPHTHSYYSASQDHRDYRYSHGMKEVDEHAFFTGGSERDHHQSLLQFKPLGMGPYGTTNTGTTSPYAIDLSKDEAEEKQQQQQHCFVLGADLRLDKPREESKPLMRHNFFDEWPHEKSKVGSAWMGLEGETQLSISIPMAAHGDLAMAASRFRNDE